MSNKRLKQVYSHSLYEKPRMERDRAIMTGYSSYNLTNDQFYWGLSAVIPRPWLLPKLNKQ